MAEEVRAFQATFPAGTLQSAPLRIALTMPVRKVDVLEIVIPPGPSGLMGFAITMGGVSVLPIQPGTYVITDNETITWQLSGYPTSGAWQIAGYNTDVFDHTVYMRWLLDQVSPSSQPPLLTLTTMDALSSI